MQRLPIDLRRQRGLSGGERSVDGVQAGVRAVR
jgi:hypothetical protein